MGCLPRSACLGSLSLTQSLHSLVLEEGLEIRDNHLCAIREHMSDSEWSRPMGFKLARENLQSRVKEEDSITDVKNTSKGQSLHASRTSRRCARAQSTDNMPFCKQAFLGITVNCGLIESRVKHLLGGVVQAMMSPGGSIVASLENVNGFLAVYTPPDDLIRTDFGKKGVVPKVMLHIFEELVLLLE
nr:hypothetical protein [Tanacetum cinerariifolium]